MYESAFDHVKSNLWKQQINVTAWHKSISFWSLLKFLANTMMH